MHRPDVKHSLYLTLAAVAVALASFPQGVSCLEPRRASAQAGPRGWQAAAAAAAQPIPRSAEPVSAPLNQEDPGLRERRGDW